MAIYEYYCGSCKQEFQLMRSMSQFNEPGPCPTCGKPSQKLVSAHASKIGYYLKPSSGGAFRSHKAASETAKKGKPKKKSK
ncbi:MAG: zinc ribbon domain-containing protein [SAR202 cluster bacterium]|nr:zinc ribbon domain-containing protein [SAR202 cluster bacterium]